MGAEQRRHQEDGKGALIAVSGAFLTYLLETIPNLDFGLYTPMVVAASAVLINSGLKLITITVLR